jgi:hypothetical protein
VTVEGEFGTAYTFPGGFALRNLPMAIPQIGVGGIMGTELNIRFFTYDIGRDFKRLTLIGMGIRHDINQYIQLPLSHWCVGITYTDLKSGDVLKMRNFTFETEAGNENKRWFYSGGLGVALNQMDLHYLPADETESVDITLKAKNPFFAYVGGGIRLGAFRLGLQCAYRGMLSGNGMITIHI